MLIKSLSLSICLSAFAVAFSAAAQTGPITIPAQSPSSSPPWIHGIQLQSWTPVDADSPGTSPRLYDAVVKTGAIFDHGQQAAVHVRILFPDDYQTQGEQHYPVLLLLHGVGGSSADWPNHDVQNIVDGLEQKLIVVMPDGGLAGWYSDWQGPADGGFRPLWETFHIDQLVPWIDANLRTIQSREGRAIAGLSMGGFGVLKYAANNRAVFSSVGSFSGVADLLNEELQDRISQSMYLFGAALGSSFFNGSYRMTFPALFFDPEAEETQRLLRLFGPQTNGDWPDGNPSAMSLKYQGLKVGLYVGRGTRDAFETNIAGTNDTLHARLNAAGVQHRYCTGDGVHQFAYWQKDLADFLRYVYEDNPVNAAPCTENAGWFFQP